MPIEADSLFRGRVELLGSMLTKLTNSISDFYTGEDGNAYMILATLAGVYESVFVALQVMAEDMFVTTANPAALDAHGEQYEVERSTGTVSTGELLFTGAAGTSIDAGAEVAYDPGGGIDLLYFVTTEAGTIPSPGDPAAPTLTDLATSGNLTGAMEYVVTFVTADGETSMGVESSPLTVSASRIHVASIPLGGTGTTGRKLYRQKNGGGYKLVTLINDNTTTTYDDNVADGSLGAAPPEESTAERITLEAQSIEPGSIYNAAPGTITSVVNAAGVTDVVNTTAFLNGSDPESTESYRQKILARVRNPQTGSPADIKEWAEEIDGVGSATVFTNTNEDGDPENGHVLIRITAADGSAPDSALITLVEDTITARGYANITYHVLSYVADETDVEVTITPDAGYVLDDLEASIVQAITNYIDSLGVGDTLVVSAVIAAVKTLPGVFDVVVDDPTTNQTTDADTKRTPGEITVNSSGMATFSEDT